MVSSYQRLNRRPRRRKEKKKPAAIAVTMGYGAHCVLHIVIFILLFIYFISFSWCFSGVPHPHTAAPSPPLHHTTLPRFLPFPPHPPPSTHHPLTAVKHSSLFCYFIFLFPSSPLRHTHSPFTTIYARKSPELPPGKGQQGTEDADATQVTLTKKKTVESREDRPSQTGERRPSIKTLC